MESKDKEKEYEHNVWEIYRREWATASSEKKVELNKRIRRWQELMKNGLPASQAYYRAMQEESDKPPINTAIEEESDYRVVEEGSDKPPRYSLWSWMRKVPSVVLILALVASIVYGFVITRDRDTLNTELERVQSALVTTQSELSSTNQTLSSVQQDLTNLQATLSRIQQQLAVAQETLGGLGITLYTSKECYDVTLIDNPTATNPSWSQLMTFLSQDQTEQHTYTLGVYDCSQFSRDVHNNAEVAGIRAAEVGIWFSNKDDGHALNAFLTTDYGLVYVDCTGAPDTIAHVKTGKEYRAVEIDKVTGINVRNDYWWDTLSPYVYYYISSGFFLFREGHAVTSYIEIYW